MALSMNNPVLRLARQLCPNSREYGIMAASIDAVLL